MQETTCHAAAEQTFDVLQIGTQVYSNVTVTTKSKTYVFLLHSAGMATIKVSDLSPELKERLGYSSPVTATKVSASNALKWVESRLNQLPLPEVVAQARTLHPSDLKISSLKSIRLSQRQLISIVGGLLLFWLLRCACHSAICRKAGTEPGALIWIPVLKLIPLLKAAKMSTAWTWSVLFLPAACLMDVIWCFKIASARGKSPLVGFLLLIPVISVLPFLYLAFSSGAASAGQERSKKAASGSRVMSLGIA
jgi:hypothetical protein